MTSKLCINQDGRPVTVKDLEHPAWLATAVHPHKQIYIYGPSAFEAASAALSAALPCCKVTLAKLESNRRRRLIAPLFGDLAQAASYVIIDVTEELRREIAELRELANKAKARMGGSVDITLRGKVSAVTLCYIDPEEPDAWWDSFVDSCAPAWIPEDIETHQLVELTEGFRSDCHGIQVWDSDSDSIRFTCYPKNGEARVESADLEELLYPFAQREVVP